MTQATTITNDLTLSCLEPDSCSLVLEPSGIEVLLVRGHGLRLRIVCDASAEPIDVAYSPGCITVWIPSGTLAVQAEDHAGKPVDLGTWF